MVGAGWISQSVFMPGVARSGNSVLTALITGDAEKARVLSEKYALEKTYSYEEYDRFLADRVADAVYVATPNWDHEGFVVRALEAGVHVLLEKPAEVNVERAERIFAAAEKARARGVRLMVAYRLHFEPASLDALRRVRAGEIGEPLFFTSQFSQHVSPHNHRAQHGFDAGPVTDMGPYPINAARTLFGAEPIEVSAYGSRHPDAGLGDMDDTVAVTLRFPSERIAQFVVSYAGSAIGSYQLVGTKGVLEMPSAYSMVKLEQMRTTDDQPKPEHESFGKVDQFAGETRYFSQCILDGIDPEPDAEEGLFDVRVTDAIRRALETGTTQKLAPRTRRRQIDPEAQLNKIAAHAPAKLVHASPPQKG